MARAVDGIPELDQVVQVPLQFLYALADPRRADDDRVFVRELKLRHDIAQLGAFLALNAARNAAPFGVVRHQDEVAAGEAYEGRQGRALVAALFLLDLDYDLLTFAYHILDTYGSRAALVLGTDEIAAGDLL